MVALSVIICTYNPVVQVLNKTLAALRRQTLKKYSWELIIVDNSSTGVIPEIDWHPNVSRIIERTPGLVFARLAGFRICTPGALIVFVDDDNVLAVDYLQNCLLFHRQHPEVGCFSGRSLAEYETNPPAWFFQSGITLGCQDFGPETCVSDYKGSGFKVSSYPDKAPIGTGMVVTYQAFSAYVMTINKEKLKFGRKGQDLTSGEDNDIVLTIIKSGFEIAYVPALIVTHLIPLRRYSVDYLVNMAYQSNRSWVKLLELHQLNQRKKIAGWTVPLRQARAWFKLRAWESELNYIKWKGACGIFKGQSELLYERE